MTAPSAREQLQFLLRIQRLLSEGAFVSTYKFALLLALAECAVERGDDTGAPLPLHTTDLADKFLELYWKHVLPWVGSSGMSTRLRQATGGEAAILQIVQRAHALAGGSFSPRDPPAAPGRPVFLQPGRTTRGAPEP